MLQLLPGCGMWVSYTMVMMKTVMSLPRPDSTPAPVSRDSGAAVVTRRPAAGKGTALSTSRRHGGAT